jgi:GT2 family glycosyltransferase
VEPPIDVSIILVSWNTRDLLLACLASLPGAVGALRADVWVVDNGSADGSAAAVRAGYPSVNLIVNARNAGFAHANNQAIAASAGRYVLLLNSDTVAAPGAIERLVGFADAHPAAGCVGPRLLNPDGSFQGSFADFPSLASELLSASGLGVRLIRREYPSYGPRQSRAARRVGYIQGACMLVRRAAIAQIGPMDEQYFMYSEEVDWCLRLQRAGWEIWYTPDAQIVHYGGQSTRQVRRAMVQALYRSKVRFFQKYYGSAAAALLRGALVLVLRSKWLLGLRADAGPPIGWRDLGGPAAGPGGL